MISMPGAASREMKSASASMLRDEACASTVLATKAATTATREMKSARVEVAMTASIDNSVRPCAQQPTDSETRRCSLGRTGRLAPVLPSESRYFVVLPPEPLVLVLELPFLPFL